MLANTFTINWWLEREIQIQKLLDYDQSLFFFFRFREGGRACDSSHRLNFGEFRDTAP